MLKYFQKLDKNSSSLNVNLEPDENVQVKIPKMTANSISSHNLKEQTQIINANSDLPELPSDPGKRPKITTYHPNIRERIRRKYYLDGPCQPNLENFPQQNFDGIMRRFNRSWYDEFSWLEYSKEKDAAFCLYCYIFKNELGQGGGDAFTLTGFRDWKHKYKLRKHEGGPNSAHKQAFSKCEDLLNQKQHIEPVLLKMTDEAKLSYKIRLNASIDCIRWLLKQGLAFRGHDESKESSNQGNFLELLKFLASHNEDVRRVALNNAPGNLKVIAPCIQKDIVSACASETTNSILEELGDGVFCVLLDDSRDVSIKEQMVVVWRFVDKNGHVLESILGFKHVECTSAVSLKEALEDLLNQHGLTVSMLRGQGYDGASNMRGEFNGLKSLILKENHTAYYVHCFAHQLQLALVAVAKNHIRICELFLFITNVVNVVGGSCKQKDNLREQQVAQIIEALENEEIASGRGLNQESTLARPCDTRWSSHYNTILGMINIFGSIIGVLRTIVAEGTLSSQRAEASRLVRDMLSFDFVFDLHLMKSTLGITNELCKALQRKDQDIVNAMVLVDTSKKRLQAMRDDGLGSLVKDVSTFCAKYKIMVPDMDALYVSSKRLKRKQEDEEMTNSHRYRVEVFNTVIDMQLLELNGRFNEVNTELLLCVACLNPSNHFKAFDREKLVRLAEFYPNDFRGIELLALSDQLENFVLDVRARINTSDVRGLGDLAKKMVETGKSLVYPLVYKLLTLALILPVATASAERAFSAMKIVKNRLRNRMGDEWMNDNLVVYIEKDIFNCIPNEAIINRFHKMAERRGLM